MLGVVDKSEAKLNIQILKSPRRRTRIIGILCFKRDQMYVLSLFNLHFFLFSGFFHQRTFIYLFLFGGKVIPFKFNFCVQIAFVRSYGLTEKKKKKNKQTNKKTLLQSALQLTSYERRWQTNRSPDIYPRCCVLNRRTRPFIWALFVM